MVIPRGAKVLWIKMSFISFLFILAFPPITCLIADTDMSLLGVLKLEMFWSAYLRPFSPMYIAWYHANHAGRRGAMASFKVHNCVCMF